MVFLRFHIHNLYGTVHWSDNKTVQIRHYDYWSEIKRCAEGMGDHFYKHTTRWMTLWSSASSKLWEVSSRISQPAGQNWISWSPISRIGSWPWSDMGGWPWWKKSVSLTNIANLQIYQTVQQNSEKALSLHRCLVGSLRSCAFILYWFIDAAVWTLQHFL